VVVAFYADILSLTAQTAGPILRVMGEPIK
jgi:hypothetical protein